MRPAIPPVVRVFPESWDPRTETCIAHQVPGFGEALDCADGCQDGERSNEPDARELDQKREPGISTDLAIDHFFNGLDLFAVKIQGGQIQPHLKLLHRSYRET